ncbi:MAG: glycosyltransferase family 9 protein [Myxococcota bacterium]
MLKRLEWLAKNALAVLVALLCLRPGRRTRARARLSQVKRVLLVRIDHRVGEVLLTTPVIERLAGAGYEVHLLVHPKMVRVLDGHPKVARQWAFTKTFACVRRLRAERFDAVVDCGNWDTESVTSAIVARLVGGPSVVLGPAHFPAGWLADVPVAPLPGTRNEVEQRAHLVSPLVPSPGPLTMSFRPTPPFSVDGVKAPYAVVNPGGRLGERRLPPDLFARVAQALADAGVTPLVTWGPGEEALVDAVCAACPKAVRAPPTTLDELASLMREAKLTVCNNTGPMHLAVAVGSPTLAFFFNIEMDRWSHPRPPHRMVDLSQATKQGQDVARFAADEARVFLQQSA